MVTLVVCLVVVGVAVAAVLRITLDDGRQPATTSAKTVATVPQPAPSTAPPAAAARTAATTATTLLPPPRRTRWRRFRALVLLLATLAAVGLLLALVLGAGAALFSFGLRAAVKE